MNFNGSLSLLLMSKMTKIKPLKITKVNTSLHVDLYSQENLNDRIEQRKYEEDPHVSPEPLTGQTLPPGCVILLASVSRSCEAPVGEAEGDDKARQVDKEEGECSILDIRPLEMLIGGSKVGEDVNNLENDIKESLGGDVVP